jgi:hypothetical protein
MSKFSIQKSPKMWINWSPIYLKISRYKKRLFEIEKRNRKYKCHIYLLYSAA